MRQLTKQQLTKLDYVTFGGMLMEAAGYAYNMWIFELKLKSTSGGFVYIRTFVRAAVCSSPQLM